MVGGRGKKDIPPPSQVTWQVTPVALQLIGLGPCQDLSFRPLTEEVGAGRRTDRWTRH